MSNRNCWPTVTVQTLILGFALLANANPAHGHGLDLDCHVEPDGEIHAELLYHDGTPARGAVVRWLDEAGNILGQSRTDKQGQCIFRPKGEKPSRAEGIISGHRTEFVFQPEEGSTSEPADTDHAAHLHADSHTHHEHSHSGIDSTDFDSDAERSAGKHHHDESSETIVRIVAGLALILGAAALVMGVSQRKTIHQLQQRVDQLGREKP